MRLSTLAFGVIVSTAGISAVQARELCMAVADAATGKVLVQRGDCTQRVTPASTFKIAISLMGYDSGFLKDEHTPTLPFVKGYPDWRENWKHPTDPSKWMRDSVVWYSQQITRSLGKERFAAYTRQFGFGNADVSGDAKTDGLTGAWLASSLRISPLEQLTFLSKVVNRQLGVSDYAYDMTARLTKYEEAPAQWDVHGKTGAALDYGWYVGWATKGQQTFVFARLLQRDAAMPADVPAGAIAREDFYKEFPALIAPLAR